MGRSSRMYLLLGFSLLYLSYGLFNIIFCRQKKKKKKKSYFKTIILYITE
ncbi:hypothetical protein AtNW77_Chr1g0067701 [Arabidopsis thaliana]